MNDSLRITMKKTESNRRGQQSQQQKRSVSFLPNVLVYHTNHLNEYSKEEIQNSWYSDREIGVIVSDCMAIISWDEDKKSFIPSTHCFRGLEYRTPEGQKMRMSNKLGAMDTVLDEQDIQRQHNENDVDELREIYSEYSEPCHAAAHRIAVEDEKQATIIYREDDYSLETSTIETSKVGGLHVFIEAPTKVELSPGALKRKRNFTRTAIYRQEASTNESSCDPEKLIQAHCDYTATPMLTYRASCIQ